jgi:Na+-transporting methylmalonyl-CoA/oxaloacetate decarboxylase gamma subunit
MVTRRYGLKEIALGVGFVLLLLVILTFYIWYQTEAIQLGYRIGELEVRGARFKEDIKRLEAKRSELLSLRRIEGIARGDLGLVDPGPGQVIYEGRDLEPKKELR